jgi:hypothetical protein
MDCQTKYKNRVVVQEMHHRQNPIELNRYSLFKDFANVPYD